MNIVLLQKIISFSRDCLCCLLGKILLWDLHRRGIICSFACFCEVHRRLHYWPQFVGDNGVVRLYLQLVTYDI